MKLFVPQSFILGTNMATSVQRLARRASPAKMIAGRTTFVAPGQIINSEFDVYITEKRRKEL